MRPQLFAWCAWAAATPTADGHGSLVVPRPRNAVDSDVFPWNATVLPPMYDGWVDQPICPIRSEDAADKRLTTLNGQSCFWVRAALDLARRTTPAPSCIGCHSRHCPRWVQFSNGCAHGCAECDGVHANGGNHPGGTSFCGNRSSKATICDPSMRAYGRAAACGSAEDFTYFNPWRRPGAAPVFDACGMAGGEPLAGKENMQGAKYTATIHAKQGDRGSVVLPPMPTGTIWTAGQPAAVSWTMRANRECRALCISARSSVWFAPTSAAAATDCYGCRQPAHARLNRAVLRWWWLLLPSLPAHRKTDRRVLPAHAT